MANETITYLEGNENKLVHIFYEFYIFLYLLNHDSLECQELHNILEESRRIHARCVVNFFVKNKNRYKDDLIVSDIVEPEYLPEYIFPKEKYKNALDIINKSTAHLTLTSCKENFYTKEKEEECKKFYVAIAEYISHFTWQVDKIIKDTLREKLKTDEVSRLISQVKGYDYSTFFSSMKYYFEVNQEKWDEKSN